MSAGDASLLRRAAIAGLLLLLGWCGALLLIEGQGIGLADNGDGYRVLDKAFVPRAASIGDPAPGRTYPMAEIGENELRRLVPDSFSALIAQGAALAAKALGAARFDIAWLTAAYLALFLGGVLLLMRALPSRGGKLAAAVAIAAILLCPVLVGYFNSPFEEAAVLALAPGWTALLLGTVRRRIPPIWLVLATTLLIYAKPSMVLMLLPVALVLWREPPRARVLMLGFLVVVVGLGVMRNQIRYGVPNAYNRVFDGLALSSAAVSTWPERDFLARRGVQQDRLGRTGFADTGLPESVAHHWGSPYWPEMTALPREEQRALAVHGRLPAYLGTLLRDPALALAVARESWLTALRADYRLHYLYPGPLAEVWAWLLARLGHVLSLGVGLFVAAAAARRAVPAALLLPLIVSPVFIVVADGYFEFEKHLLPYLAIGMFTIVAAADLLLTGCCDRASAGGARRAGPDDAASGPLTG
ncbi:hypothetical protein LNKW23_13830 [Paralimibaculum aggregatum]|uniref:Glycosyltransferase RgtA/B/C/D-like domain-containing protein n=1 Tax=Paralimibaculum aggregatum TaxID=3036245 RepID=A0ABQ6LFR7_9RHOB|nr:hypothetical protein [Limibaculum sp. NKW23]GMG82170.1 hypothetical protein LNKW23_13830 [Limibaculum sp. NKW23]